MAYKRKLPWEVRYTSRRNGKEQVSRFKTREEAEKAIEDITNWNLNLHGLKPPAYRIVNVAAEKEEAKPRKTRKTPLKGVAARDGELRDTWK